MIGIYKIENLLTHQCYIGQSKFIERRWNDHKNRYKNGNSQFYLALQKYGIENFSWEVIEECSQDELDEKEIYWIEYYDSFRNGYNSTPGGQFQTNIKAQDIYDAWEEGLSCKQISEKLGIGTSTIYYTLVGYENYSVHESKVRGGQVAFQTRLKEEQIPPFYIHQYDLDGNYINSWNSAKEIEQKLNIDADTIGRVLNGKYNKAGGFMWSFEKTDKIPPCKKKYAGVARKVKQYDLNGNFIQEFNSCTEAARAVHGSSDSSLIRRAIDNSNKTAYGYKWKTS